MLRFLGAILRVVVGFVLACVVAGYVQVLFAVTPMELVGARDDRLDDVFYWGLLSATQIAVFAAPFALIAVVLSEWMGLRSFAFHAIVGMAIAVAGFGLIHMNESAAEASIVNSYAMAAYLTSGFVGGFVYWLLSGRFATRSREDTVRMESDRKPVATAPVPPREKPAADARPLTENERMAKRDRVPSVAKPSRGDADQRDGAGSGKPAKPSSSDA